MLFVLAVSYFTSRHPASNKILSQGDFSGSAYPWLCIRDRSGMTQSKFDYSTNIPKLKLTVCREDEEVTAKHGAVDGGQCVKSEIWWMSREMMAIQMICWVNMEMLAIHYFGEIVGKIGSFRAM